MQVVSAIGAPEGDLLGAFKNTKKIDGEGAIALVQAAEAAGVQHFVMVRRLQETKSSPCDAGRSQTPNPPWAARCAGVLTRHWQMGLAGR